MIDPELKAAAERAKPLLESIERNLNKWRTWFPNEESEVDVPRADLLALASLAKAYLAQHNADDDEPVTEDWLRSVGLHHGGFSGSFELMLESGVSIDWCDGEIEIWDNQCNNCVDLPGTYTARGQVRQLLEALGIKPKKEGDV